MTILLLLSLLAAEPAGKVHPALEYGVECSACHDKVFDGWNNGRHGVAQVRCATCHGTPGDNFAAKPAAVTCRSCHPAQFEKAARSCLACHSPHTLAVTRKSMKGGHR